MKLSVSIGPTRQGKKLPREVVATAWGFHDLTVPDVLRRLADIFEVPPVTNRDGVEIEPARGLVESVAIIIERTDL